MWTVSNQLKGILKFPSLGVEIQPSCEFDLDAIGRDKAEASRQLKLALESGYLRTVRKTYLLDETELEKIIESRIAAIKENLATEIHALYRDKTAARV